MKYFDNIPANRPTTPLLDKIESPADLRLLSVQDLSVLADELRYFMIYAVGNYGGHFASGLGVVELTIALHYVFSTPNDSLVWDVGHQSYPHKILTGRRDAISTIRKFNGLAPFSDPQESIYDAFISGHASTSISAALGILIAAESNNQANNKTTNSTDTSHDRAIAIIGDGALTGGMAFEALNHAGNINKNLIVILNDNNMSISNNVGALSKHFSAFFASNIYQQLRTKQQMLPNLLSYYNKFASKSEQHLKKLVLPSNIFEQLGFQYFAPIDGYDLPFMIKMLHSLKNTAGPVLLHVRTVKGKGFKEAEYNPISFHAVNTKIPASTDTTKTATSITYANVFGKWINTKATKDPLLHAITPAMCEGSDLLSFKKNFENRYHDVGIAEQHSLTLAAGMAIKGLKPVVVIYSTFLQRAYDQLIHDICLQNLNITIAIDRAGLVGGDGATHNGIFDLSYLRIIPNLILMTPTTGEELSEMLDFAFEYNGVVAVRYPRGKIFSTDMLNLPNPLLPTTKLTIGKASPMVLQPIKPKELNGVILLFGALLPLAIDIADKLNLSLVNMRFVAPLDQEMLLDLAGKYDYFISLEENVISGGAGSAVNEFFMQQAIMKPVLNLGLENRFFAHGDVEDVKKNVLDSPTLIKKITKWHDKL